MLPEKIPIPQLANPVKIDKLNPNLARKADAENLLANSMKHPDPDRGEAMTRKALEMLKRTDNAGAKIDTGPAG